MLKQETLDIADTNMALFGSNVEKEIKKFAANGEPAWKDGDLSLPGIRVWRIEKFQIKPWPKDKYGYFYDGDSYIVLNTYKKEDKVMWNVHFWLGLHTTQDEAGTAAYKTVELDDFLNGDPVQYREVQGSETKAFLTLFPKFVIQSGGIDSGFNHVEPEKYRPRLLQVKGTIKNTVVREVPLNGHSLNSGDVFVLDTGKKVFQFQGKAASGGERSKAGQIVQGIDDERGSNVEKVVLDEADEDKCTAHEKEEWGKFWTILGGKVAVKATDAVADTQVKDVRKIFKVSDASGAISFSEVPFKKSSLAEDDVFVVVTGSTIYTWVGRGANANEKKSAFQFAQKYLNGSDLPKSLPIVRILSGAENDEFLTYF